MMTARQKAAKKRWRELAKKFQRNRMERSPWFKNKPQLALRDARIAACYHLTKHAEFAKTGFCLCTHAMFA